MRKVYRISLERHARDFSGKGARLMGGRWNSKGTALIYTSESRSLAAMEFLVHVSLANIPPRIVIAALEIPASIVPQQIDLQDLPKDWRSCPPPFVLGEIGTQWVSRMESLLLRVPSAVVAHEFNLLINPAHPEMKSIKIQKVEHFIYDERLRIAPQRKQSL